jgi:exodeoxyribonuclease VIII
MKDIMLDLETMGAGPHAAIIAIGAVEFDLNRVGERFYETVDLESSVNCGGVIDASTVMWWMKQSQEARAAFAGKNIPLPDALIRFASWLENRAPKKDLKIWGNGASFDNVILSSAYSKVGIDQPWVYYGDRCYRTMKGLHPEIKLNRIGTYHNAVNDAESQALHLIDILRVVR